MKNKKETGKLDALFEYIKEVCLLNQQKILDVEKQLGAVPMHKLDDPACVKLFSRDTVAGESEAESEKLFTFHNPDFTMCPAPDASLERRLLPGWHDYRKPLEHLELIMPPAEPVTDEDAETTEMPEGQIPMVEVDEQLPRDQLSMFDEPVQAAGPQPEYFTDDPERVALFGAWAAVRAAWVEREKHTERLRDGLVIPKAILTGL